MSEDMPKKGNKCYGNNNEYCILDNQSSNRCYHNYYLK